MVKPFTIQIGILNIAMIKIYIYFNRREVPREFTGKNHYENSVNRHKFKIKNRLETFIIH